MAWSSWQPYNATNSINNLSLNTLTKHGIMAYYASINRLIAWLITLVSLLPIIGMAQCTPRFVGMTLDQVKAQSKFTIHEETYGDLNGDGEGDFVIYIFCTADSSDPGSNFVLLGLTTEGKQKVVQQYLCSSMQYPWWYAPHDGFGYYSHYVEIGEIPNWVNLDPIKMDGANTLHIYEDVGHDGRHQYLFVHDQDLYLLYTNGMDVWDGGADGYYRNYLDGTGRTVNYPDGIGTPEEDWIIKNIEAIEALPKRIIPYDPNHPERGEEYYAYNRDGFLAGDSLMKHHQYEEAVDAYDQQVIQNPWDDEVYLARAKARHMADDFVGRCEDWHMASKLGNSEASRLAGKYCRDDTSEETE